MQNKLRYPERIIKTRPKLKALYWKAIKRRPNPVFFSFSIVIFFSVSVYLFIIFYIVLAPQINKN